MELHPNHIELLESREFTFDDGIKFKHITAILYIYDI